LLILLAGLAGLVVVLMAAWWLMRPARVATLSYRGQSVRVTLPQWSVRLSASEGQASYLTWGSPDLERTLATPGDAPDFRHVEQMGAAHVYVANGLRLRAVTRKQTRLFTRIDVTVEPADPRDPREPREPREPMTPPRRP
jgi:hypothetical protein